ncbi:MAG: hypothetical protein CL762_05140 [Chloroflexi bacterium]|nr:hypothetical protein [Chloroflexota bacterium]|tara:strand:+ start:9733 stop:10581 length:849 start_codon:yes stop_codon:yes gene_type:complete
MPENIFKASDVDINYFHNGVESKKTLLFIHGWQGGWEVWKNLIDQFGSYKIYAVDLPGHNKSGHLKNYNINTYYAPILEFVESINGQLIIVGHSLGASISLQVSSKLGSKITHQLLEDPPWFSEERGKVASGEVSDKLINDQLIKYEKGSKFFSEYKPNWRTVLDAIFSYQNFDPEIFKTNPFWGAIRASLAFHHDIKIWQNAGENNDWVWHDAPEISKNISAKTYLVGGNNQKGGIMLDVIADKVSNNIDKCDIYRFDTGHNIRFEKPEEYAKLLNQLINS